MAYLRTCSCTVHVTIFSTGSKFRPISNFTELRSYSSHLFLFALEPKQSYLEVVPLAAVFAHLNGIGSEIKDYVSTAEAN